MNTINMNELKNFVTFLGDWSKFSDLNFGVKGCDLTFQPKVGKKGFYKNGIFGLAIESKNDKWSIFLTGDEELFFIEDQPLKENLEEIKKLAIEKLTEFYKQS